VIACSSGLNVGQPIATRTVFSFICNDRDLLFAIHVKGVQYPYIVLLEPKTRCVLRGLRSSSMTTTAQSANSSTNSNQNVFILPQITVQHDLSNVIDDVRDGVASNGWEDVWVSCYLEGRPSTHGKLRITRSDEYAHGVSFEARDGVQWQGSSTVSTPIQCNFHIYYKLRLNLCIL
jgi:hypothetical protein